MLARMSPLSFSLKPQPSIFTVVVVDYKVYNVVSELFRMSTLSRLPYIANTKSGVDFLGDILCEKREENRKRKENEMKWQ